MATVQAAAAGHDAPSPGETTAFTPRPDGPGAPARGPLTFAEVLAEERAQMQPADGDLSAICLSGGGIRSAALSLGVLQGLARRGVLKEFHYLSTVSGGGFVGGFLTACMAARGRSDSVTAVHDLFAQRGAPEFPELRSLRKFTNYLTPNPGLGSPDTWAGIVLWLRNTFVNWLVFLPLMLTVATVPPFYFATLGMVAAMPRVAGQLVGIVFALGALVCLAFAIANIVTAMPSHEHPDRAPPEEPSDEHPDRVSTEKPGSGLTALFWRIVIVATGWSVLAPLAVVHALSVPEGGMDAQAALRRLAGPETADPSWFWILALPVASVAVAAAAFRYAEWAVDLTYADTASRPSGLGTIPAFVRDILRGSHCPAAHLADADLRKTRDADRRRHADAFRLNRLHWAAGSALAAAFLGLGLYLATGASLMWLALAGPLWVIVGETLRISLYVALRREALRGDLDREWLARLNGIQLGGAITLCALGTAALLLSSLAHEQGPALWTAIVGGGLASGSLTARLGRSALTVFAKGGEEGKQKTRLPVNALLYLGIALFGAALLMVGGALAKQVSLVALAYGPMRPVLVCFLFAVGYVVAVVSLVQAFRRRTAWGRLPAGFDPSAKASAQVFEQRVLSAALAFFGIVLLGLTLPYFVAAFQVGAGQPLPRDVQYFVVGAASLLLIVSSIALALWLGRRIDLNTFSMHAVYRNRLVRAFLGTARTAEDRREDRFTSFDPNDDVRVAHTFDRTVRRLFPVINLALNRTSGKDTARAERKAETFTITPLHCGSPSLRQRVNRGGALVWDDAAPRDGAYVDTARYASGGSETGPGDERHGITLGTAMALSGAAASPNMGYHSSPLVAFVMTLFNVRLGGWLPNPAGDPALLWRAGPANAVPTLLSELGGRSDDRSPFVYLSDGGHVDNLGLIEMLRRRCDRIVVVDAGQDADYAYGDLGSALQHARIDLGIEVAFFQTLNPSDPNLPSGGAFAKIRYPAITIGGTTHHAKEGRLLYLKSWLSKQAPTDLRAFQALKRAFPHDSTLGNQFFTESDFESYRRLGEFLTQDAFDAAGFSDPAAPGGRDPGSIEALFEGLEGASIRARARPDQPNAPPGFTPPPESPAPRPDPAPDDPPPAGQPAGPARRRGRGGAP